MLTQLPHYFTECCVVYVPEMGHLIVVKQEEPKTESSELEDLGFQFMVNIFNSCCICYANYQSTNYDFKFYKYFFS